jgi:sugar phosphate isomerase/epimerase
VIGEGNIPVEQCLAILKRTGYDGYLTVEYEGAEDCISGIARGLANLRSMTERI